MILLLSALVLALVIPTAIFAVMMWLVWVIAEYCSQTSRRV